MAQILKDAVLADITAAARRVFAKRGYNGATMAQIAVDAGVSTGNVYRYFASKRELFEAAVSPSMAKGLAALVRRRVEALNGIADLRTLRPDARYFVFSEELLQFCIQNRHAVIVLLGRSANTLHEGFSEQLIDELVALAIAYAESVRADFEPTPVLRFALEQLYRSLVAFMVELLERYSDEPTIRAAVEAFSRYHLTGMRNLFAAELLDGT